MYKFMLSIVLFTVVGCSTSKEKIFKDDMPTMKEIYEENFDHLNGKESTSIERPITQEQVAPSKPSLTAYEKLAKQFPKAPNPIMMIYVFPHLTTAGTPVPGYNTYFTLYERDHFMLSDDVTKK